MAGLTVLVTGWLTLSASTFVYFRDFRGLQNFNFADVAFPTRWHRLRTAIGEGYLRDAEIALKENQLDQALRLYRAGIARAPLNVSGRIALARLYLVFRRPDLAKDLLLAGLAHLATDKDYLSLCLGFLLDYQYDAELKDACTQLLRHPESSVRPKAALFMAAVAFHRGDYDETESLLLTHQLTDTPDGSLLLARADYERGFPELALTRLTALINAGHANTNHLAFAAEIQQRLGQRRDLDRSATLLVTADPLAPAPRIALLRQLQAQQRPAETAREIENFIQLFRNDQSALLSLGDFAAHTGNTELAHRIQLIFADHHWPADTPALLYAEACISAGRHHDGLAELDRCLQTNPGWAARHAPTFDGLRTVAFFGLNRSDDARLQLEHLLGQPNLRTENLTAVADRLLALGRLDAARLTLGRAVELDPRNQSALATLVRLEAEQGLFDTLPTHLHQFLALRRPSPEILSLAYHRLGSDLNLFHREQQPLLAQLRQRLGRATPLTMPH